MADSVIYECKSCKNIDLRQIDENAPNCCTACGNKEFDKRKV
jgi:DNA-directed RNA polymerase subunit RPC12/RpoP